MKNDETWPVSIPEQHGDDEFLRSAAESTPAMQIAAVQALTGRILGGAQSVDKFTFEILSKAVPGDAGKTCFELAPPTAAGGVAVIRGSTGVELAAGLGHYLRHVANVSFSVCSHYRPSSTMIVTLITNHLGFVLTIDCPPPCPNHLRVCSQWPSTGGTSFDGTVPGELPALTNKSPEVKRYVRSAKWLNSWNVCTFSYSFVWWNFDRWQQEIDLMVSTTVIPSNTSSG